jgi:hypothetical protein
VTELEIPQERDLPPGRFTQLKEDLMTQIEQDLSTERATAGAAATTRRRPGRPGRRIVLAAAAVAAVGLGLATSLVLGGHERASANTAVRNEDGSIVITLNEAKHPKDLERRLNDLGVPAVVDFLESGYGCDESRSTGWSQEPPAAGLFEFADTGSDQSTQYVLQPDLLQPGETVVFEFQIDEHEDDIAANVMTHISTAPVGPCVPVPNASIVDAERGIAGG